MDLQEFDLNEEQLNIQLEEQDPAPPVRRARRRAPKKRPILWVLVGLLCIAGLLLAWKWNDLRVKLSPLWALQSGAQRVMALPQPASVGFLGSVELEGLALGPVQLGSQSMDCSGVVELQTSPEGLQLFLKDCTLGSQERASTFSLYMSPQEAAASIPALLRREGWYGLRLDAPLESQVPQEPGLLYGLLGLSQKLPELQARADSLRQALAGAGALGLGKGEAKALAEYLKTADVAEGVFTEEGYLLTFRHSQDQAARQLCQELGVSQELFYGPTELCFSLYKRGTLYALSGTSANLCFQLDLGEAPERELTPRLEAEWRDGEGRPRSLILALTVEGAQPFAPPEWENIFALL